MEIKKFNEYNISVAKNENTMSSPNEKDATYQDMDNAIKNILDKVKNGLVNVNKAVVELKNIINRVDDKYPLSGS